MAGNEPRKLAFRSLSKRPAETVLLIIGIALGIGTTAGGVSMVAHLEREGNELLQSTGYREIVVSTRDSAADMEVPAYRNEAEETVILTGADLVAREITPDVEFAYTLARRRTQIGNFGQVGNFGGGQATRGQGPPPGNQSQDQESNQGQTQAQADPQGQPQSGGATVTEEAQAESEGGDSLPSRGASDGQRRPPPANQEETDSEEGGQTEDASQEGGETGSAQTRGGFDFRNFEFPEYSGVAPAIDQVDAVQITPEFFNAYNIEPAAGSLFTQQEIDSQRPVAVVGSELAKILYEDGIALGREILLFRTLYEIIGVAEPTGTDLDDFVIYPSFTSGAGGAFEAALARFGGFGSSLRFTVYEADRLDEAQAQLQSHFNATYGTGAVVVRTPGTEARETIVRNSRLVTIILFLAIAGLLIAAVNVSNILYGRAMRKRKSVGILKALGASRRGVFNLFLGEALAIGTIGAILGIGVSIGFTQLLGETYASSSLLTLPMIAGALGGFIITLALTTIPALQASAIPAAEALHYE